MCWTSSMRQGKLIQDTFKKCTCNVGLCFRVMLLLLVRMFPTLWKNK